MVRENSNFISLSRAEPYAAEDAEVDAMNVKRSGSSAYWDSEAWNPDDRVYVGACDGQTHRPQIDLDLGQKKVPKNQFFS